MTVLLLQEKDLIFLHNAYTRGIKMTSMGMRTLLSVCNQQGGLQSEWFDGKISVMVIVKQDR